MTRRKYTPLEEEAYAEWDRLVFGERHANAPRSESEAHNLAIRQLPDWDTLLQKVYHGRWLVGYRFASAISQGRFFVFMVLRDYASALRELERLEGHPGIRSRADRAEAPILLAVTRMMATRSFESAVELELHLRSGVYAPSKVALSILQCLSAHLSSETFGATTRLPDELRSLLRALVLARKGPERLLAQCDRISTWSDFDLLVEELLARR